MVKNFPLTKSSRIAWWEKNKDLLKSQYNLPPEYNDTFMIFIVNFGNGYKVMPRSARGSDLLCFDDIKIEANCVDKDLLITIGRGTGGDMFFR
ncbi:hypothetical protein AwWohl_05290 [Gammaproteobacteria bacterium]|nr:hypothetical protein AwWohl_05290 [Gammaproteobacteria bacterium]